MHAEHNELKLTNDGFGSIKFHKVEINGRGYQ